ncbi:MAG: UrcA family protein [Pseudomonadota bacterium]
MLNSTNARNYLAVAACAAFAATFASAMLASPAYAHQSEDRHAKATLVIDLSNFDLSNPEEKKRLVRRIKSEAGQLCSPLLHGVKSDMRAYRGCVDLAVDEVLARVFRD